MPEPPAHLVLMAYAFVSLLTFGLVANAHTFRCEA
jgi:hypothetical protein